MGDMNPILITVRADNGERAQTVVRDYVTIVMGRPTPKRVDTQRVYETRTITTRTGVKVEIGTAEQLGLDGDGGRTKWYTVCEKHGSCVGHSTRRLADSWATSPEDWCEFCQSPDRYCDTCQNSTEWCDHITTPVITIHADDVDINTWAEANGLDINDDETFNSYSEWKANQ